MDVPGKRLEIIEGVEMECRILLTIVGYVKHCLPRDAAASSS